MRPQTDDHDHNLIVGRAMQDVLANLISQYGMDNEPDVSREIGERLNRLCQAGYDLGVREAVEPFQN